MMGIGDNLVARSISGGADDPDDHENWRTNFMFGGLEVPSHAQQRMRYSRLLTVLYRRWRPRRFTFGQ